MQPDHDIYVDTFRQSAFVRLETGSAPLWTAVDLLESGFAPLQSTFVTLASGPESLGSDFELVLLDNG